MAYEISKKLNIRPQYNSPVVVHVSSGDSGIPITFEMYDGNEAFEIPSGAVISVQGTRRDGASWITTGTASENEVTFTSPSAMAAVEGAGIAEVSITSGAETVGSANFLVLVERATIPNGVSYSSDPSVFQDILNYFKNAISVGMEKATSGAVAEWLEENITPTTPAVDASLSVAGAAADAAATGALKSDLTVSGNLVPKTYTEGEFWYENGSHGNSATAIRYNEFTVPAGIYYFANLYAYFCYVRYGSSNGTRFSNATNDSRGGTVTVNETATILITSNTSAIDAPIFTPVQYLFEKVSNFKDHGLYLNPELYPVYMDSNVLPNEYTDHKYWRSDLQLGNDTNSRSYSKIILNTGTYYYKDLYAYFCYYRYPGGSVNQFKTNTNVKCSGSVTLTEPAEVYITVSIANDSANPLVTQDKTLFDEDYAPPAQAKLIDGSRLPLKIPYIITVGGNGMFSTIKEAADHANTIASRSKPVEIHINSGTYDVLDELGGESFLASLEDEGSRRNGIRLNPYISLIGHGKVLLTYFPDDSISTYATTEKASPIEVWGDVKIKNIHIRAKNCRYCVHDEGNNDKAYEYSTHIYENCYFHHLGNFNGGWTSCDAIGQGTCNGNTYIYKNSVLRSDSFYAYSTHNNGNQSDGNTLIFDGVDFQGNYGGYAVKFGYYLNNTTESNIFFKSCKADNPICIVPENSSATHDNVYVMHNFTDIDVTVT